MKDWTDQFDYRITKAKTGYVVESSNDSEIYLLNEQAYLHFVQQETNNWSPDTAGEVLWYAKESMDAVGVFCFNKVG